MMMMKMIMEMVTIFIRLFGAIYYNVVEDDDNGDDGDLHQVVGGGRLR